MIRNAVIVAALSLFTLSSRADAALRDFFQNALGGWAGTCTLVQRGNSYPCRFTIRWVSEGGELWSASIVLNFSDGRSTNLLLGFSDWDGRLYVDQFSWDQPVTLEALAPSRLSYSFTVKDNITGHETALRHSFSLGGNSLYGVLTRDDDGARISELTLMGSRSQP